MLQVQIRNRNMNSAMLNVLLNFCLLKLYLRSFLNSLIDLVLNKFRFFFKVLILNISSLKSSIQKLPLE